VYLPTRNLVRIKPKFESDKIATKSDLILYKHDSYKGRTTQGIVEFLGPEVKEEICIGDYVFYPAYSGTLFYDKEELFLLIPDDQLMSRLENIPDTSINGLFVRERIDLDKNRERLVELVGEFQESQGNYKLAITGENRQVLEFIEFIKDKVDSYGAYFEVPFEAAINLITQTLKEAPWAIGIEVGGGIQQNRPDLYVDKPRECQYCGGKERMMEDRKEATVFYKCLDCNRVRDRRMIKDVQHANSS
jgi:hypothetical protein